MTLVVGLAVINAAGVSAQLVAAHIGDRGSAQSAIETQDAELAARIESQAHMVADLDARVSQIDAAIAEQPDPARTNAALSAIDKNANERFARNRNTQTCVLFARRNRQDDFAQEAA